MSEQQKRRDFIGMAFGAVAAVGGVFALVGIKRGWDPLPSVRAAGITTVDLTPIKPGQLYQTEWRKKPIFILKKSADMKPSESRDAVIGGERYIISVGLCTHLGCIPSYKASTQEFICACHGGIFDINGINVFGPPPAPLEIPPFKVVDNTTLILGETGPEYEKLMSKA